MIAAGQNCDDRSKTCDPLLSVSLLKPDTGESRELPKELSSHPAVIVQTGGNVAAAIARDDPELLWAERGHQIALDISRGLAFLHSHQVCHGELRPGPPFDWPDDSTGTFRLNCLELELIHLCDLLVSEHVS